MQEGVEATIAALKRHLDVQSDQDLARRLHLGRSTISSWRARGAVPNRYRRVLDGEAPSLMLDAKDMTEEEGLAMALAIMRLFRKHGDVTTDPRAFLASGPHLWTLLVREYHQALEDFTSLGANDVVFHGWVNRFNVFAYDEFFPPSAKG